MRGVQALKIRLLLVLALFVLLPACGGGGGGSDGGDPPGNPGVDDPTPPAPRPAGLPAPSVGVNLAQLSHFQSRPVFLNHLKSSRVFLADGEIEVPYPVDANGYPTALPVINGVETPLITTIYTNGGYPAGRYVLRWQGEGELDFERDGRIDTAASSERRLVFDIENPRRGMLIRIKSTDPRRVGNHIRNMSLVDQRHIGLHDAGVIFHPDYVQFVQDFRVLRFMDWMQTNNSTLAEWADRPRLTDATYTAGVPVEAMVELANLTGADPWFTFPHMATDDFIRRFAQVVRDRLDPDAKAYFEYSNETWNGDFEQNAYAIAQGVEVFGAGIGVPASQYTGFRTAQMADIIDAVYGSERAARVVRVLAGQGFNANRDRQLLSPANWRDSFGPRPHTKVDAFAIATYFGASFATPERLPVFESFIQDADGGFFRAFRELERGDVINDGESSRSMLELEAVLLQHTDLLQGFGLPLITYEGGQHVVGARSLKGNQRMTDFFHAMNRHAEMGRLYRRMMTNWRQRGQVFVAYNDVGQYTQFGSWGLIERFGDNTPKYEVMQEFNSLAPNWTELRAPSAFLNGHQIFDNGSAPILRGGNGRDTFVWQSATRIMGDGGRDRVIMPKPRADYTFANAGSRITVTDKASGRVVATFDDIEIILGSDEI